MSVKKRTVKKKSLKIIKVHVPRWAGNLHNFRRSTAFKMKYGYGKTKAGVKYVQANPPWGKSTGRKRSKKYKKKSSRH